MPLFDLTEPVTGSVDGLASLYGRAVDEIHRDRYDSATVLLDRVLAVEPEYRDAAGLRETAERRRRSARGPDRPRTSPGPAPSGPVGIHRRPPHDSTPAPPADLPPRHPAAVRPAVPPSPPVRAARWKTKRAALLAAVLVLVAVAGVLFAALRPSGSEPATRSAATVRNWNTPARPLEPGRTIDLDARTNQQTPDLSWNAAGRQLEPVGARGLRLLCRFDPGEQSTSINDAAAEIRYLSEKGFPIPEDLGLAPIAVPGSDPSDQTDCGFHPGTGTPGTKQLGWAVTVLVNTDQNAWSVAVVQRVEGDKLKVTFATYTLSP